MLYLLSIGLWDEKDLSIRAIEVSRKCQKLYAEFYTSDIATDVAKLARTVGRAVIELKRSDLEEHSQKIISEAKTKNIGIFVPGDALSATTHIALVLEAKRAGIPVKIVHSSSILTAIAETGLSLYKFGRVVTLPKSGCPPSLKRALSQNKKAGLHSLILLDIGLKISDAIEILIKNKAIKPNTKLIAAARLGSDEQIIRYGPAAGIRIDASPAVLILPSKLHFIEKEFLSFL